jgi:uroporphyrinogen-III synthase
MIERFGGKAIIRPAQGTVFMDESNIDEQLHMLISAPVDWLILTTGVGTEALFESAEKQGVLESFITMLKEVRIAARGYKTVNVLRKYGCKPTVIAEDGTTAGLLRILASYDVVGRRIALQLYGDPNPKITKILIERGAICEELLPYVHIPPDGSVVHLLVQEIINREVHMVTFTSTCQARYVMSYASGLGLDHAVREAFRRDVLAVAVGQVTAEALQEEGIARVLFPEEERMGTMVVAMAKFAEQEAV